MIKIEYGVNSVTKIENSLSNLEYTTFFAVEPFTSFLNSRFKINSLPILTQSGSKYEFLVNSLIANSQNNPDLDNVFECFLNIALSTQNFYGVKANELIEQVGKTTLENALKSYFIINKFLKSGERIIKKDNIDKFDSKIETKKEYYLGYELIDKDLIVFLRKIPILYRYDESTQPVFKTNPGFFGTVHSTMPQGNSLKVSFKRK